MLGDRGDRLPGAPESLEAGLSLRLPFAIFTDFNFILLLELYF